MVEEKLWPTATASDAKSSGAAGYPTANRNAGTTLTDAVVGQRGSLYPTPSAVSYGSNRGGAAGRVGPVRESLESLARQWPTPQSRDEKGPTGMVGRETRSSLSDAAMPGATAGRLNQSWVLVLMGFPSTWLDIPFQPVEGSPSTTGSRRGRSRVK